MNLYLNRRKIFAELMRQNSAALFFANDIQKRNNDTEYRFRQNSNFWYLTGFNEPNSALLILKTKNEEFKSILFVLPKEKEKEIWTGLRAGIIEAKQQTNICECFENTKLEEILEKYLSGLDYFYFDYNHLPQRERILEIIQRKKIYNLENTINILGNLRLFKDDYEIEQMKASADIAVQAHKLAIKNTKANIYEYFLEAKIEGFFKENGADWAYPSIIASGENATILHYTQNDKILKKGNLLLIDAGCEKNYYASDITRTFPIQSKFTNIQKEIYELVLKAQKAGIQKTKLKNTQFDDIHTEIIKILSEGLIELKLLNASLDEVLEQKHYRKFYMHRSSHWLGLDVHDSGDYFDSDGNSILLKPRMALTIEPGLYFDPQDESIPHDFRGIGIRIEDDILITENGSENLTEKMPKEIGSLEELIEY